MAETITITDDRTGKSVTVPISDGVFPASAIRELDANLFVYDPAYMQTAACKSAITYLDGNAGILRYRGYPIEQLAEQSTYLEVAYLLLKGELPDKAQLEQWTSDVTHHTYIHENMTPPSGANDVQLLSCTLSPETYDVQLGSCG